jgi:hypothetical protein
LYLAVFGTAALLQTAHLLRHDRAPLAVRILDEEKFLAAHLKGYRGVYGVKQDTGWRRGCSEKWDHKKFAFYYLLLTFAIP